jgi:hypothetical protein
VRLFVERRILIAAEEDALRRRLATLQFAWTKMAATNRSALIRRSPTALRYPALRALAEAFAHDVTV